MEGRPAQTFQGFRSPNTTPIPDEVFDELLADLTGAELKVLLYICRRTFGWKKESDNISLNQMLRGITKKDGTKLDHGAGLSKPTLLRTIRSLVKKGIIIAEQRDSKESGHEPTNYRLCMADPLGKKMTLGEYQNFTKPLVKKSDQGLVKKVYQEQETVLQETVYKTVGNGVEKNEEKRQTRMSDIAKLPDLEQPPERTAYVAQEILSTLKDTQSERFYQLVARKIPELVIRQALSEIKQDGANSPPKLFVFKMRRYALQHKT